MKDELVNRLMKIMIIEDDLVIASSLQEELMKWQYDAFYITDFNDVMNTFTQEAPQLVLIDIKLPYFNGYYWCTEIRKISQGPIIFVSSQSARMGIVLKTSELKVQYQDQEVALTKNEIKILEVLFLQKGAFVSREAIMMKLWENDSFIDDNTLAVNINRLRKKLAEINVTSFIVTKKGFGYGLQKDEHDETK